MKGFDFLICRHHFLRTDPELESGQRILDTFVLDQCLSFMDNLEGAES